MSRALDRLRDNVATRSTPTEVERVCSLLVRDYQGSVDLTPIQKEDSEINLRPIQLRALEAISECRGGFLPIGVGEGKTFIGLLAGSVLGADLCVFVAPAGVVPQIQREKIRLDKSYRLTKIVAISYGCLSQPGGTDLLVRLFENAKRPLLVLDEAHRVRHRTAARTKRVIRFLRHRPETMVVAMSGTLTAKSLSDFAHLSEMCLRGESFMPLDEREVDRWANCLDAKSQPSLRELGHLNGLQEWAKEQDFSRFRAISGGNTQRKSDLREAFALRMRSAPGVVASTKSSVKASLRILLLRDLQIPTAVAEQIQRLGVSDVGPNGEVIVDDLTRWRLRRQLSCGFWYRWVWKDGVIDHRWLDARNSWNRHVRRELETRSRQGYDSPSLVRAEIEKQLVYQCSRRQIHAALREWMPHEHKPEPPVEAVWIDDYLIRATVHWCMQQRKPVCVWYESQAVRAALSVYGLPAYYDRVTPELGPIACSIRSQGVGLNMQQWDSQIVIEPPSSGSTWEQLLGRTHRTGQSSDTVRCAVWQHTDAYRSAFNNAVGDSRYIQSVTGVAQKLRYADIVVP